MKSISGLCRIIDVVFWALMLAVLLLFALQFSHPASWDAILPIVKLHEFGDPLLDKVGRWLFMKPADAPAMWPTAKLRFFPIFVIVIILALRVPLKAAQKFLGRTIRTLVPKKAAKPQPEQQVAEAPAQPVAAAAPPAPSPYTTPQHPGAPVYPAHATPTPHGVPVYTVPPPHPGAPVYVAQQPYPGQHPPYATPTPQGVPVYAAPPQVGEHPTHATPAPQGAPLPPLAPTPPELESGGTMVVTGGHATHVGPPVGVGQRTDQIPKQTVAGSKIGRYEIISELGRGAMGVVYKARDPKIDRILAIKKILGGGLSHEEMTEHRQRFQREAQSAGRLTHPGIIGVYDILEDGGQPCLALEFVEGATLEQVVAKERFSLGKSLDVMLQISEALGYAHKNGVIHRDLKPANILVTTEGRVKIADFGIAKMVGTKLTKTGVILGTPAFMSPEQFQGSPADSSSDIFSIGSIIYWLCTGEYPFQGESVTTVAYKIVQTTPIPSRQLNPALPPEIDLIIDNCLNKNPKNRYQNGTELNEDLQAFRDGLPLSVERQREAE